MKLISDLIKREMMKMIVKELFIPYVRIKYSDEELKNYYIHLFNKKKNLYEVIYSYHDKPSNETAIVDKIFLDFDPSDNSMDFFFHVRTVTKYLYDNDIEFYIRFSGRGFHVFINLDNQELNNPKLAIKQYVYHLHQTTNTASDNAVVGDLRRPARLVNTMNLKTQKYCIPITYDELQNKTYQEISDLAICERHVDDFINGSSKLDISAWDGMDPNLIPKTPQSVVMPKIEVVDKMPPCIEKFLQDPQLSHKERFQLMLFLRDLGYTYDEIEKIFYGFLDDDKFYHMTEEEHQIQNVCPRDEFTFSPCHMQKMNGYCPSEECAGCNLYY